MIRKLFMFMYIAIKKKKKNTTCTSFPEIQNNPKN